MDERHGDSWYYFYKFSLSLNFRVKSFLEVMGQIVYALKKKTPAYVREDFFQSQDFLFRNFFSCFVIVEATQKILMYVHFFLANQ